MDFPFGLQIFLGYRMFQYRAEDTAMGGSGIPMKMQGRDQSRRYDSTENH